MNHDSLLGGDPADCQGKLNPVSDCLDSERRLGNLVVPVQIGEHSRERPGLLIKFEGFFALTSLNHLEAPFLTYRSVNLAGAFRVAHFEYASFGRDRCASVQQGEQCLCSSRSEEHT